MPCNSDYMMPTQSERLSLMRSETLLKNVLDTMTHDADVAREIVLAAEGYQKDLKVSDLGTLTEILASSSKLIADSKKYVEDIYRNYTFQTEKKNSDMVNLANSVIPEYERAIQTVRDIISDTKKVAIGKIKTDQVRHRKGDIQRLIIHFAKKNSFIMVEMLSKVDFNQPLEPQIGFDPDKY